MTAGRDIPPEQAEYFADDEITLQEYQAAFSRFQNCASDSGYDVRETDRDPLSGLITFQTAQELDQSLPAEEQNATTKCFVAHFMASSLTFTATDPSAQVALNDRQLRNFENLNAPCLRDNAIAVPADLKPGSQEYLDLLVEFDQLAMAGKCEGVEAVAVP